jgi:RNA polymerase sigma-70 factor (ECF subfamily)
MERSIRLPFAPAVLSDDAAPAAGLAARLRAASAGDEDAFAALYADYVRMVHAILLARVPRCEVDDLVQDVFLAAFKRLGSLRDANAFGGWLAAIARNRATDYLRQARQETALPADLPGGAPIEAGTIAALQAMRKVPEAYRETLFMRLVEGMSGAEIAERTGMTCASVRINLHRGMRQLRRLLGLDSGRE